MRAFLLASILVVLIAASAPGLMKDHLDRQASLASVPEVETASHSESSSRSGPGPRQVEVRAQRDGHFYVDAEINFRPVRLMVDTGASVIALRRSDAEAVGIRPRPGAYEHPVSTANGTVYAAEAELASISIRDIEVAGVRAMVLPDELLGTSLLGASFLNRLKRFEVSDGTLVFEN